MFFMNETVKAKEDLKRAARLPGAPPITARLAAEQASRLRDYDSAIIFLVDMIKKTTDPNAKKALKERLKQTQKEMLESHGGTL